MNYGAWLDYVQRSAERAFNRRQQLAKRNGRTRQSVDEITRRLDALENRYGKHVARTTLWVNDRMMQIVVGAMVHDMRSILTHLRANCFTLMEEVGTRRRESRKVRNDLDFCQRTLRDMELFTQPIPRNKHRERFSDLVSDALEMARNSICKKRFDPNMVTVQVDVPESLTAVVTRHRIVTTLANLIENAYEAFKVSDRKLRAGEVTIHGEAVEDQALIRIEDNGMGLANEEFVSRSMFVPGRRNKSKKQITGYGLANAARVVAAHGGMLSLDSEEDVGTIITMRLPINGYEGELF